MARLPACRRSTRRAIDGEPIGPRAGSCGTAIYRREAVVVEDIETDPLWTDYRPIARVHGLRACWSTPIFDPKRNVLGTFALYCRAPARPSGRHNHLIEMATHTASIAIVKAKGEQEQIHAQIAVRNRDAMARSVFENAGIGMTVVSMDQRFTKSNPAFSRMLGIRRRNYSGSVSPTCRIRTRSRPTCACTARWSPAISIISRSTSATGTRTAASCGGGSRSPRYRRRGARRRSPSG